jgi:RNA polymerase sigma factor (sigma-70 family)
MGSSSKKELRQNWRFPSTQWSAVLAAKNQSTAEGVSALAVICRLYWRPLYTYVRCRGHSVEDAQDLIQSYFCRLLEKDYLCQVNAERGKFRSFLMASLKNFLANEWDRKKTQKRGGEIQFLSLEEMNGAEKSYGLFVTPASLSPEKLYERSWALALLDRVTGQLAAEFAEAGKMEAFEQLKIFLTGDAGDLKYADAAVTLGMSEVAARVAVHRLRGRFRDLLRIHIAQTVAQPEDPRTIEEEIRYLMSVL